MSEKVEIPESKSVFILGIVAIGTFMVPYAYIVPLIIGIIGLKKHKISKQAYKNMERGEYSQKSRIFMIIGGFLCLKALAVALTIISILTTILPFFLLAKL
ncbi:MAG: hypothetical protein LBV69_07045 [Bacteroidales bacterium]|jgi:hypothetical protein|nr:hypothetical protein [Bacteroidales bacterium]